MTNVDLHLTLANKREVDALTFHVALKCMCFAFLCLHKCKRSPSICIWILTSSPFIHCAGFNMEILLCLSLSLHLFSSSFPQQTWIMFWHLPPRAQAKYFTGEPESLFGCTSSALSCCFSHHCGESISLRWMRGRHYTQYLANFEVKHNTIQINIIGCLMLCNATTSFQLLYSIGLYLQL